MWCLLRVYDRTKICPEENKEQIKQSSCTPQLISAPSHVACPTCVPASYLCSSFTPFYGVRVASGHGGINSGQLFCFPNGSFCRVVMDPDRVCPILSFRSCRLSGPGQEKFYFPFQTLTHSQQVHRNPWGSHSLSRCIKRSRQTKSD